MSTSSTSSSRDSQSIAVAVVVPESDEDALEHYSDGIDAGPMSLAQESRPALGVEMKVFAGLCLAAIVALAVILSADLRGGSNGPNSDNTNPAASTPSPTLPSPCSIGIDKYLATLEVSSTEYLNCYETQGTIPTTLGKFTALISLE
jgi:hypothetical protein